MAIVITTGEVERKKCPVCNGTGVIDGGFFSGNANTGIANTGTWISTDHDTCRMCNGTGVIARPVIKEIAEQEKWAQSIRKYCFFCKKVTLFYRCYDCGKRFCSNHAFEDTESIDGHEIARYSICYHCSK